MSHSDLPDEMNPYAAPKSEKMGYGRGGFGDPGLSGGKVRFGAIGDAFELIRDQMGMWLLMSLVYFLASFGIGVALSLAANLIQVAVMQTQPNNQPLLITVMIVSGLINWGVSVTVNSYLMGGMYLAALKQVRGQRFGIEDLFGAGKVLGPLVVATLLTMLATIAGMILLIIPGIYIGIRLSLALPLVVDRGLSGTEAMKWSWRGLEGQVLIMFATMFCAGLLGAAGVILCCVGLLFTLPIPYLTVAIIYRDIFMTKPAVGPSDAWVEAV
jgi:uncharacterized membrane protein